jgi:hypothetical protein
MWILLSNIHHKGSPLKSQKALIKAFWDFRGYSFSLQIFVTVNIERYSKMAKMNIFFYFFVGLVLVLCGYFYFRPLEGFELKCIISTVDGNKYCVRERDREQDAADLLATVTDKCKSLVQYVGDKHREKENVQRLVSGFNPQKVMETLPTSEYTAYSENKGEKLAFCLNRKKEENDNLIDENTLTFVAIHELSHVMTKSIGHKTEFWQNFKFLLENAKAAGIHHPIDYSQKPSEYCGMTIHDNPAFDNTI